MDNNTLENPRLIVSFTSYPARIYAVKTVLESLYAQSMQASKILLWLAEEQFPNKEKDLPDELLSDLEQKKFELKWCDDLGSHKKYFYVMQEYPNDIIITVDDDVAYDKDMIAILYKEYQKFPKCICALHTFLMQFEHDKLLPPGEWLHNFRELISSPSHQLCAVGSGGILYPPSIHDKRVFNKEAIKKICTTNNIICENDAWLKVNELLNDVPVVFAKSEVFTFLPNTQEQGIHKQKNSQIYSDTTFQKIIDYYDHITNGELSKKINVIRKSKNFIDKNNFLITKHNLNRVYNLLKMNIHGSRESFANAIMSIIFVCNSTPKKVSHKDVEELKCRSRELIYTYPEIESIKNENLSIRGFLEYGEIIPTYLWGKYKTQHCCVQMLKNWNHFLFYHRKEFKEYESTIVIILEEKSVDYLKEWENLSKVKNLKIKWQRFLLRAQLYVARRIY